MAKLPEQLRRESTSYFSWLSPDLTQWYIPLFLRYIIDSSSWRKPFRVVNTQKIIRLSQNSINVITSDGYLLGVEVTTTLVSKRALLIYNLTETGEEIQPAVIPDVPLECIPTVLPDRQILLSGCSHNSFLVLVTPQPDGTWTKRQLTPSFKRESPIFDADLSIYLYQSDQQSLQVWDKTGEYRTKWITPVPFNQRHYVIINQQVYFSHLGAVSLEIDLYVWSPGSPHMSLFLRSAEYGCINNIFKLMTDHHGHLIIVTKTGFTIFNLVGQLVNDYSFDRPHQFNELILHPRGSIHLHRFDGTIQTLQAGE